MTLPPITPKEQQILTHLYTYRFLTTIQLQRLIGHNHKGRTLIWLRDLRSKGYIEWHYDTSFIGRTKPASYYLGVNGIRWLRATGSYPESELLKRYRDKQRSASYIETCRLVANTVLTMKAAPSPEQFQSATPAKYNTWIGPYTNLKTLQPTLVFIRRTENREAPYLLEVMRSTSVPLYVRHRVKAYLHYLTSDDWAEAFAVRPTVLFVCPDKQSLLSAKRFTGRLLGDSVQSVPIRFTTLQAFTTRGISAAIWEVAPAPVLRY